MQIWAKWGKSISCAGPVWWSSAAVRLHGLWLREDSLSWLDFHHENCKVWNNEVFSQNLWIQVNKQLMFSLCPLFLRKQSQCSQSEASALCVTPDPPYSPHPQYTHYYLCPRHQYKTTDICTCMELAETPQAKSHGKTPWAGLFSGSSGKPFLWMTFLWE